MSSVLKDVEILVAENLLDEAEKRLIQYLAENPRDSEAIEMLARIEKQLYLQKKSDVKLATPQEALEELKRIARLEQEEFPTEKVDLLGWLEKTPPELVVDLCVMLGFSGFTDIGSQLFDKQSDKVKDLAARAEACGWMARFYLDAGQPIRARQWSERAVTLLTGSKHASTRELTKQLRILLARCLWESGERQQALTRLTQLAKEFKKDSELTWIIENYSREL